MYYLIFLFGLVGLFISLYYLFQSPNKKESNESSIDLNKFQEFNKESKESQVLESDEEKNKIPLPIKKNNVSQLNFENLGTFSTNRTNLIQLTPFEPQKELNFKNWENSIISTLKEEKNYLSLKLENSSKVLKLTYSVNDILQDNSPYLFHKRTLVNVEKMIQKKSYQEALEILKLTNQRIQDLEINKKIEKNVQDIIDFLNEEGPQEDILPPYLPNVIFLNEPLKTSTKAEIINTKLDFPSISLPEADHKKLSLNQAGLFERSKEVTSFLSLNLPEPNTIELRPVALNKKMKTHAEVDISAKQIDFEKLILPEAKTYIEKDLEDREFKQLKLPESFVEPTIKSEPFQGLPDLSESQQEEKAIEPITLEDEKKKEEKEDQKIIHGILELKPPEVDDAPFLTLTFDFSKIPDSFHLSNNYGILEHNYYKYKSMLVKAQEYARKKLLKNALNYYRVVKSQNIPPEFTKMINRNIKDITEFMEKYLMSKS